MKNVKLLPPSRVRTPRRVSSSVTTSPRKAPTGIIRFDEITTGGLPKSRATLVIGWPGSGKTIAAMQFRAHGARGRLGRAGAEVSRRKHAQFEFRLYVAGVTRNSELARANVVALCATLPAGQCTIEVADVLVNPDRALQDGIFMTPTLARLWPQPSQFVVGTLGHTPDLIQILGMHRTGSV